MSGETVIWHDLECGGYAEDLPLWRELAEAHRGPILDVGAGTGRVALDLAARGHEIVALDSEAELLAALDERAAASGAAIKTVVADARAMELGRRFQLVLVPMQTVQLFGGAAGRAAFLERARAHLRPNGLLALALADAREGVDDEHTEPPLPDLREIAGTLYASRPVALRAQPGGVVIERVREVVDPRGQRRVEHNAIRLDDLDPATLEAEARRAGLAVMPRRAIAQTEEYVGSTVVMLGG